MHSRPPRLRLLVQHSKAENPAQIASPHSDEEGQSAHHCDVFGSSSPEFRAEMMGQLMGVVSTVPKLAQQQPLNAAIAAVEAVGAENEIEAMLAVQMASVHSVAMLMLSRAKHASTIEAMQEYGTLATKMLRAYTAQTEALAKLRRGGEQKVIVEHVHVYPGGQAVVGAVEGGGGVAGNRRQPHAIADASQPAVRRADQEREFVPVTGNGEGSVPDARRR